MPSLYFKEPEKTFQFQQRMTEQHYFLQFSTWSYVAPSKVFSVAPLLRVARSFLTHHTQAAVAGGDVQDESCVWEAIKDSKTWTFPYLYRTAGRPSSSHSCTATGRCRSHERTPGTAHIHHRTAPASRSYTCQTHTHK